jgi:hypothetical protein
MAQLGLAAGGLVEVRKVQVEAQHPFHFAGDLLALAHAEASRHVDVHACGCLRDGILEHAAVGQPVHVVQGPGPLIEAERGHLHPAM